MTKSKQIEFEIKCNPKWLRYIYKRVQLQIQELQYDYNQTGLDLKCVDLNLCNTIQIHYKHWQGLISSVWTNLGERQIADSLVHQQIGHHWRGEGDMRAKILKHFNLILDDISKFRNYRVKIMREICRCNLRESRLIPFGLASRPSFVSPLLQRLTLIVS